MLFDEYQISEVHRELERRREILIKSAKNMHSPMLEIDRNEIISYLEHGAIPARPETVPDLMKTFITSCFSYAILRKYCVSILGEIPTIKTIDECLMRIFNFDPFKLHSNWSPENLIILANEIQNEHKYNLDSNEPKPRMIRVLIDGSVEMGRKLENGIAAFYRPLDEITNKDPELMWMYVNDFSDQIYNVGPALICDFLKNIGYSKFVKVDHHFKNQFPTLIPSNFSCKKMSPKRQFILSLKLAERLKMTPFHLDKILYNWGRYGV